MVPLNRDISIQSLSEPGWEKQGIRVSVLRLDQLHPVVSGNKWFKLQYFIQTAQSRNLPHLLSFGGPYSNHLVALAFACHEAGLHSTGIVRGEQPEQLSPTLQQCLQYGMHLEYVSRDAYKQKDDPAWLTALTHRFGPHLAIPEGGYHPLGARGAAAIPALAGNAGITHWVAAMGTATTVAGILSGTPGETQVIGIAVLKGMTDIHERLHYLLGNEQHKTRFTQQHGYHFSGYAKASRELFAFMNTVWEKHQLPLDFVYTAKMLYGVYDLISNHYFAPGSHILCIHTGGLQGNRSLPPGTLSF